MGTSKASDGPGSGVPLLPPWTPDPPPPLDGVEPTPFEPPVEATPKVAPAARWAGTRRSLGQFSKTGDTRSLRRGLSNYTKGVGGSSTAARRFAATSATAQRLAETLSAPPTDLQQLASTTGNAYEVIRRVVGVVSPSDGTQDAEANAAAVADALADLLTEYPSAQLTDLTSTQIDVLVELFIVRDICNRIDLDVGESVRARAPDYVTAVVRLKNIHEYVGQVVATALRDARIKAERLDEHRVSVIAQAAIAETFRVFEEDIQ